ncbi:unnamed protein product [Hymenolepis diminuta]|uniref:DMAP-interaction domain-containing protein n=1 Tax=Hymenolepis diminuta TaxID=6216 RepID=A0A0R3SNP9_HYMDI|nr:unnamed protein product [Hymenolepis diminuta]
MGDANPLNMDPELQKKLVELDKELAEGDITEKGYQKKKAKILERFHVHYYENTRDSGFVHASNPYLPPAGSSRPDSPIADPSTPDLVRRSSHHRYARDEVRYRSGKSLFIFWNMCAVNSICLFTWFDPDGLIC